jgi:hypothetical protein
MDKPFDKLRAGFWRLSLHEYFVYFPHLKNSSTICMSVVLL